MTVGRRRAAFAVPVIALVVAVLGLGPVACREQESPSTTATQQQVAESEALLTSEGFGCRLLRVSPTAAGAVPARCVWVADTPALRSRGLMGVGDPGLGGHDAMAFTFGAPTTASFWMKDTLIPLTVAWVGADGRILGTTDMEPCPTSTTNCPVYPAPGPYVMAIEVAQGRGPELGLTTGATAVLGDPCP